MSRGRPGGGEIRMKEYDLVVVGSGAGMMLVEEALAHGLSVALIDRGPLGGTCLNLGCIPSKMLIFPADRVMEIREADGLGITAEVRQVDFLHIMERMRKSVRDAQAQMRQGIEETPGLDFYEVQAHFIADYTLQAGAEQVKGKKIVLASGARPLIPPIAGLDETRYLTNESLLQLHHRPASMIIIGGGYIAVEYAHFFEAMGTKVTMLEMGDRLVPGEEPEISRLLKEALGRRMEIYVNTQASEVRQEGAACAVKARDRVTGVERVFAAECLLLAAGRRSNADLLKPEITGVDMDDRGFIKVNRYLETSKKDIWAVGDANGRQMFTHVANREAGLVANNILHEEHTPMDYTAAPHAIYSHPQIAAVGLGEAEARRHHEILVGTAAYSEVAMGEAMDEKEGFAKVIVDKAGARMLGFHIIGPHAPDLIQEAINAMAAGGRLGLISGGMHIHPALSELVARTLASLQEPQADGLTGAPGQG